MVIQPGDSSYPDAMALVELSAGSWARELCLHVRGHLPPSRGVAVVGSREATPSARAFARKLSGALVRAGYVVWSGGALGIDTEAHRGALEAGGKTVVVLGGGHDRPFPKSNAGLFETISRVGAAVALVPDDEHPTKYRFFHRNTVLTALTEATIVVEARRRPSGAMHAATSARRLGKPVFTPPQAPWSVAGAGNVCLLEEGVMPFHSIDELLSRLRDVRSAWRAPAPPSVYARLETSLREPDEIPLSAEDAAVLEHLDATPVHVDELCVKTGSPYRTLNASLVMLVLSGRVDEPAPGYFCRRTTTSE